jgi:hypothetical protein
MGHQHWNSFNFVLFIMHSHFIIPIDTVCYCNGMSSLGNKFVYVYCWSIILCTLINVHIFKLVAGSFSRTVNYLCSQEREAECLRTSTFVHILTQSGIVNILEYVESQNSFVNTATSYRYLQCNLDLSTLQRSFSRFYHAPSLVTNKVPYK